MNTLDVNKTNNADVTTFSNIVTSQLNQKADSNDTLLLNGSNLMATELNMDQNFDRKLADPYSSDEVYTSTVKFVKDYIANHVPKPKVTIKAEDK